MPVSMMVRLTSWLTSLAVRTGAPAEESTSLAKASLMYERLLSLYELALPRAVMRVRRSRSADGGDDGGLVHDGSPSAHSACREVAHSYVEPSARSARLEGSNMRDAPQARRRVTSPLFSRMPRAKKGLVLEVVF
jgi:hypothetical protein